VFDLINNLHMCILMAVLSLVGKVG